MKLKKEKCKKMAISFIYHLRNNLSKTPQINLLLIRTDQDKKQLLSNIDYS